MRRRPLVLTILAVFHFLYPLYYTAQVVYFHNIPVKHFFPLIEVLYSPLQKVLFILLSASALVLGYGLFMVRKWAYHSFFVFASFIVIVHIFHYISFSSFDLIPPVLDVLTILFTLLITLFFINKHIKAPYFNPRLRWWENETRYKVDAFSLKWKDIKASEAPQNEGKIFDLSVGGFFVSSDVLPALEDNLFITFRFLSEPVDCKGKVVRVIEGEGRYPKGFGIMFTDIEKKHKNQIKSYLRLLSKDRVR